MRNKAKYTVAIVIIALLMIPLFAEEKFHAMLHISAIVVALVALYAGLNIKNIFAGKLKKDFDYIFAGIIALLVIHGSEIFTEIFKVVILEELSVETLEHAIFVIAMILFAYGLFRIEKTLKEIAKAQE